jgi:hypothetical protein
MFNICFHDDLDTVHHCTECCYSIYYMAVLQNLIEKFVWQPGDYPFIMLEETFMALPVCTSKLLVGSCMNDTY